MRTLSPALRPVGLAMLLACAACDETIPEFDPVEEPADALRPADARGEVPDDARITDYAIDARLDEEAHEIHGTARITWRNRTGRSANELPFHLYMNGFRALDTEWMKTARGSHRGEKMEKDAWGFIDIKSVRGLETVSLTEGTAPSLEGGSQKSTDLKWAEDADPSTMLVTLDKPVDPGMQVTVELEFVTKMPKVFARTGYHDEFHMAGQWFPKLGVLDEEAGWQNHTFSLNSEFYADFGMYRVRLDVPADYVVGATGIRTAEEVQGDRKTLTYEASMVHDFAWTADPDFVEHWGEHEGIRIRQLIQPEYVGDVDVHMDAQIGTLESMQERFGPYPWSTITIVHAREGAGGAGGMEYPTLYTTSNVAKPPVPKWFFEERFSGVFTTVHEFGHQYFQGLFASNEWRQAWLDEGMNTMSNHLAYADMHGSKSDPDPWAMRLMHYELSMDDVLRLSSGFGADLDPIDQPADHFDADVGAYGGMTYGKTAALMLTLRHLVGEPFDEAMKAYAAKARFRHPTGRDLEQTLVEVIGDAHGRAALAGEGDETVWLDVQDFLDQGLRETTLLDFAVHRISNRKAVQAVGWHRDENGELVETEAGEDWNKKVADVDDEKVQGTVVVHRHGGFRVPVEVLIEFEDDQRVTLVWDGQARHRKFEFPGRRVRLAIIDPERKLLLEHSRLDNVRYAKSKDAPSDGLSDLLGDETEAISIALMGGLGL